MGSRTRALAGVLTLTVIATLFTGNAATASPRTGASHHTEGKAQVVAFTNRLYNRHDLSAINAFVRPDFIQHDPRIADGPAGLRRYLTAQNGKYPHSSVSIKRVVGENNLVAVQSNLVLEPGTRGYAVLDLYRLANGRIAEHWESTQEVPATTVSGNDMFSTLSSPPVNRADPTAPTALNKQIATDTYTQLFIDKDVTALDRSAVDPYYQHNPTFPNGIQGAEDAIRGLFAAFPNAHTDILRIVADGDLVVIQSRAAFAPGLTDAVFDLWRIRDRKIVEHWDVLQTAPDTSANGNTMF